MTHCTDFRELDELFSRTIEIDIDKEKSQDFVTAGLFSNMTDDEVISHFMPIRGIDYDQNYICDDSLVVKKEKDEETIVYMADELLPYRMIPQINPVYQLNAGLFKSVIPANRIKETNEIPVADIQKCKAESQEKMDLMDDCVDIPEEKQIASSSSPLHVICEEKNDVYPKDDDSIEVLDLKDGKPSSNEDTSGPSTAATDSSANEADKKNDINKKTEPRPIMKRKPRTYKYNPKPLQRKVNRAFVPDDLKDVEYWERRKKNNEAAKKSRKERREKELEIINNYEEIRREFQAIKNENTRLKARNAALEKQLKRDKD